MQYDDGVIVCVVGKEGMDDTILDTMPANVKQA